MGLIFGKRADEHDRDWVVEINFACGNETVVGSSLEEGQAKEIYDVLKAKMKDNNDFIETNVEGCLEFFNKDNIVSVEIYRD